MTYILTVEAVQHLLLIVRLCGLYNGDGTLGRHHVPQSVSAEQQTAATVHIHWIHKHVWLR